MLIAAAVCAGVHGLARPRVGSPSILGLIPLFFPLPALLVILILMSLGGLHRWGDQVGMIAAGTALLGVVIRLELATVRRRGGAWDPARLTLKAITYAIALLLFVALYAPRLRSILSASGVLLVSGLLALGLLRGSGDTKRTWLYAGVIALPMGELTWALNYCSIDARIGGTLLFLAFYTLTGMVQQHLWGSLTHRVALEFGAMCALGLAILGAFARWFPR